MKILLTGAGGFAGSYLLDNLVKNGHEVIGLYREKKPLSFERIESKSSVLIQKNLTDDLRNIPSCEVIIHTAAANPSNMPVPLIDDYLNSNIYAMNNLVKYAHHSNVSLFIYLSSVSIYGNITSTCLKEDTSINNPSMYGLSKLVGEKILQEHEAYFSSVCMRLPGLVGKGNFNPWLGTVLKKALINETIPVYSSNALFNNVVHLSDLNQFINILLEKDFNGFEAVNLAASEPITIQEVVNTILSTTNSKSEILETKPPKINFYIDTEKAKCKFRFEAESTRKIVCTYAKENLNSRDKTQKTVSSP